MGEIRDGRKQPRIRVVDKDNFIVLIHENRLLKRKNPF
jgi:hypothetical protein